MKELKRLEMIGRSITPLCISLLLSGATQTAIAASYPENIDYGSQGDFVAKRGVTYGRTANLTPIGPVLFNIPEAPGSSDAGGVVLEHYNTAWDLSDLTNPTLIGRMSQGLTQPIGAHGTVYRFDNAYSYLYTFGTEFEGTEAGVRGGDYVRFAPEGGTSLEQLIPTDSYLFQPRYFDDGFADAPLGYSMMTSPFDSRTYWEYGFDPSGLYEIRNPRTFDTDPDNPAPWIGPLMVEWDHLGQTGVTGFSAFLGELMVVASDQQSTGLAIYNTAGLRDGQIPQLISTFTPTLTEPSGNQIGIGGYWLEPYGANKMVWAARQRDGVIPERTHPAIYVVDFTDPTDPELTCEIYFNQNHNDLTDGDSSSDPMYVNFQDNYAYVDHFKVDITGCETAYQDDQNISVEEFSQIVYKFNDFANHCDASQYFRPLGQVGVFGGYDGAAAAVVTYTGSGQMTNGASYMETSDLLAWEAAGYTDESIPDSILVLQHYEPGVASSARVALSAGDEVMDVYAYLNEGQTIRFTITDVVVDERVNEQGMCFFVTSDDADTTPPYVSGHRPLSNQTNYPVDGFIHLHIPETLRSETLVNAITVTNLTTNEPHPFRHQLSHTGTLGIWPETNFDTNTAYRVDVAGIQDYMGNTMVPYSFSFATGDGTIPPPVDPEPPVAPAPSFDGTPYYPNQSGQIACESGEDYDSVWTVNPDNDTVSLMFSYTDPSSFEVTTEVFNDYFPNSDGKPSSVTRVGDLIAVTYSDIDMVRFHRTGWWGTSPWTTWQHTLDYGDRPVAAVSYDNFLYIALYGSGEVLKYDVNTRQIISRFAVGPKPKAMALTSDGSRLLVTRFISDKDYAEVYDINTVGTMSFRDPGQPSIRINKIQVPDDIDHGSGVANYLRSIVIDANNEFAYVTANKANVDRGLFLSGQALDDDNTIRPMIATLDLVNHRDINIDPTTREGTIDLDNAADPSGITILPDGVTRVHALQGNNVVEFNNLLQNTVIRISSGAAPKDMCSTLRSVYVKNYTERSVSVIDSAGFMFDGRQSPTPASIATVLPEDDVKSPEELLGLQVFYHARVPDISPEGYISCASCHDDAGHDGMTWDLTHMGEGLRNTISLRGSGGTRFGNLHWSSNFDEVQDFEAQLEGLNGADGLIPGITFTENTSPLSHTSAGSSEDLDALAAYVSGLGKESVLRSPYSCSWGGLCSPASKDGSWEYYVGQCKDCHTVPAFRDGQNHDVGTIKDSSGQRLGGPLTAIRTPTLVELWDTAPYFHDGSAATLDEVLLTGDHANMGLNETQRSQMVQYLLNLDRLDYIDDDELPPVDNVDPVITIVGYENGDTISLQVGSVFTVPAASAEDDVDGFIAVTPTSNVDTTTAGSYSVSYSATDASGNTATSTLNVIVNAAVSNTPPVAFDDSFAIAVDQVIVLTFADLLQNDTDVNADELTILFADDWENGVAAYSSSEETITFTPNSGFTGEAQFTYIITDGYHGEGFDGLSAAIVRIQVGTGVPPLDTTPPVITIDGYADGDTINVFINSSFVEPAATATDNIDELIIVNSNNTVDISTEGSYTVTYSASDAAGNTTTSTLNVVVTGEDNVAPVITIDGHANDSSINIAIDDVFTVPSASALDDVDGVVSVTTTGTVDSSVAGSYVIAYSASDLSGNIANTELTVVVSEVGSPIARNSVRQFTFNHSLWEHDFFSNASTGYWVGAFANASGTSYAWSGQFGQLDYHGLPGSPGLGSTNSPDVFPTETTSFRDIDIDNVLIMPPNFVQGTNTTVDPEHITYALRVIDHVVDTGAGGGNQPGLPIYIYEHWQEASSDVLTPAEWETYHNVTTGVYHQWFLNYQNQLMASRPSIDFRLIPVGPIIAEILQNPSLQASALSFSDVYEDNSPHGWPNVYLLAGLITYQAMYGQMANSDYVPVNPNELEPQDAISGLIANDFAAINEFVWQRLNHYNANGVRIWP